MAAKVIVVFGATGLQGGGVAKALLQDDRFKVRAVTRNTTKAKAKALESLGAEIVKGDLDDSLCLPKILTGSYGVFAVTNYWEHFDLTRDLKQGKCLVDACKAAGVKHLVFSGLDSVKDAIGKKCPPFDGKAEVEKYMFASGVPCTSVRYPAYMENFLTSFNGIIPKEKDGTFAIGIPMEGKQMNVVDCTGAGRAVDAIFCSPEKYTGKTIGFSGDKKTIGEYAEILSRHLAPKHFKASGITVDQFANLGFPGADHMAAMYDFYQRGNPDRDLALTKELDPSTLDFEDWVKENKEALNAAFV